MAGAEAGSSLIDQFLEFPHSEVAEKEARSLPRDLRKLFLQAGIGAAGNSEQVGKAIVVEVDHSGAPADIARLHDKAGHRRHVVKIGLAVILVEAIRITRIMRFEYVERAIKVVVSDPESHPGLRHSVFIQSHAALETFLTKRAIPIVEEEQARSAVAGNIDVRPSVVIEIGGHGRHGARAHTGAYTGARAQIGERAVAIIAVQKRRDGLEIVGAAKNRYIALQAVTVEAGRRRRFEVEMGIMAYKQVQPPVPVVIDERAGR